MSLDEYILKHSKIQKKIALKQIDFRTRFTIYLTFSLMTIYLAKHTDRMMIIFRIKSTLMHQYHGNLFKYLSIQFNLDNILLPAECIHLS